MQALSSGQLYVVQFKLTGAFGGNRKLSLSKKLTEVCKKYFVLGNSVMTLLPVLNVEVDACVLRFHI